MKLNYALYVWIFKTTKVRIKSDTILNHIEYNSLCAAQISLPSEHIVLDSPFDMQHMPQNSHCCWTKKKRTPAWTTCAVPAEGRGHTPPVEAGSMQVGKTFPLSPIPTWTSIITNAGLAVATLLRWWCQPRKSFRRNCQKFKSKWNKESQSFCLRVWLSSSWFLRSRPGERLREREGDRLHEQARQHGCGWIQSGCLQAHVARWPVCRLRSTEQPQHLPRGSQPFIFQEVSCTFLIVKEKLQINKRVKTKQRKHKKNENHHRQRENPHKWQL